jgi:hypothetical protein
VLNDWLPPLTYPIARHGQLEYSHSRVKPRLTWAKARTRPWVGRTLPVDRGIQSTNIGIDHCNHNDVRNGYTLWFFMTAVMLPCCSGLDQNWASLQ